MEEKKLMEKLLHLEDEIEEWLQMIELKGRTDGRYPKIQTTYCILKA